MSAARAFRDKNVLILGGLGFMGSNLALRLVELGANVTLYDALLPGYGGNLYNVASIRKDVRILKKDIRDPAALERAVRGQDYVFNFAAQVSYIDSLKDPLFDMDINVRGHLLVLEALRKRNPGAKFFYTSSRLVYGRNAKEKVPETSPLKPLNLYGIHKLACERYMELYAREFGIPSVAFRIWNPYGPRQQMLHSKYSLVGWFIRQAMEDKTIRIFGDGAQKRDYIFVDDMTEAFVGVAALPLSGYSCFNLGRGLGVPFKEMVKTVVKTVGRGRVEHVPWPRNYENIETGSSLADVSALKRRILWRAGTDIAEGVARTHEYYRQHRKHYW